MTEPRRIPRAAWSSGPRRVEGGIKARSKRGEIAQTWWSRRFIEVLESFGMGGRLLRGKNYARAGQVLSMSLSTSVVVAQVQGSRPEPYRVRIAVKAFSGPEWSRITEALARQAIFAAKLLAGEMPTDIEDVFTHLGLKLFPATMRELSMDCSCPDWEVPCKHLAATCYLLAESFDADPFEILAWRGRDRQQLLDGLRRMRGGRQTRHATQDEAPDTVSLTANLHDFWITGQQAEPDPAADEVSADPILAQEQPAGPLGRADALLDKLDPPSIHIGRHSLADLLRPAYRAIAEP
ncbi:MAG TPA: SWIM zinc finger family protein [Pseudonocardiaceae bacterium]|nr:SWIM zinc finger family protein [Pseudonocardiaceae bacterium]